ncbi:hypothetical protein QYE76_056797 [Lolium multiflorum]|uniref:Reverse transcriptase domain-containing protein n=1 Tax=Lolium multiflorum TaxID=4521 RepID=A0AAD8T2D8_LOLMU|nr:hypothetical protein QYE76_056797 [Lolium multiflorum]
MHGVAKLFMKGVIRHFHRARNPLVFLKLDVAWAFDSVSWPYLLDMLRARGFSDRWRDWIAMMLATSSSRVILNGEVGPRFLHRRGLRQGDPLSPLLFILAIEPLHRLFDIATVAGLLSPLRGRKARLRCSLYADDAAVFLNPDLDLASISSPLGAPVGSFPCRYLGLPLSFRRPRRVDFQPLLDKLGSRLARWKLRLFSHAGRLALLKAVLSALPTYLFSAFAPPAWLVKAVDRIRRAWLWAADVTCTGGRCKVAWGRVCRPRDLGGLSVLDLVRFSHALRLRWLWLQRTQPERPWVGLPVPCDDSDRDLFAAATSVDIGDGASASFWHDSWLFGALPRALAPALYSLSRRKHRCVRDALRGGAWVQDLRSRVSVHLLESFVALRALIELVVLSPDTRDKFTWRFTPDGRYSASSAYRLQFAGSVQTAFTQLIWKPWATPRCRLFAWLFVQNRLMAADRLLARGWPNGYFCPLCKRNLETATHLFIECPLSRQVCAGVAIIATAPSLAPPPGGTTTASPSPVRSLLARITDEAAAWDLAEKLAEANERANTLAQKLEQCEEAHKTSQEFELEDPDNDPLLDAVSFIEFHGTEAREGIDEARTGLSRLFPYFFPKKEEPATFLALAKCFNPPEDLGLKMRHENMKVAVESTVALVADSQQTIDWAKVGNTEQIEQAKWRSLIKAAKLNTKKILAYLGIKPSSTPSSSRPEV